MSENYQDEFQMWMDMWDEAQGQEEFQNRDVPPIPAPIDDDSQSLYARMMGQETGDEEALFQEEKKSMNPAIWVYRIHRLCFKKKRSR
jgi:hypothetical protein